MSQQLSQQSGRWIRVRGGWRLKPGTLLAIVAVALAVSPALAQFSLFDDLEDETIGPVDDQDGWISSIDNEVVVDPADAGNQVLYVPSSSSILRKSLLGAGLGVPDQTARTMFFRMRVGNNQTFSVGLSRSSYPDQYDDFATELGMANSSRNLDLRAWDDDGGTYEQLTQLTADTWYNVWVYIDSSANEYQVWANTGAGAPATSADQLVAPDGDMTFEFRSGTIGELVTFYVKTSGGSSSENFGPVYFDDIYLETSDALNLGNPTGAPTGDLDGDGDVDFDDLNILLAAYQSNADGDLDGDGDTDFDDLNLLLANYGG